MCKKQYRYHYFLVQFLMHIKNYFQDCHQPRVKSIRILAEVIPSKSHELVNSNYLKFPLLENLKMDTLSLLPQNNIVTPIKYF